MTQGLVQKVVQMWFGSRFGSGFGLGLGVGVGLRLGSDSDRAFPPTNNYDLNVPQTPFHFPQNNILFTIASAIFSTAD